ncbi:hypothetical protein MMC22_009603 [Lobaria immixta]|nr:hypothetical protein [Lobaria immixta]
MPSTLGPLPFELVVAVATYMSDDLDFYHFARVCTQTRDASNFSGVWRRRFAYTFDLPPGRTAAPLRGVFRLRQELLSKPVDFCRGITAAEKIGLKVIRDLVVESFSDNRRNPSGQRVSKNIPFLRYMVRKTNLLYNVCGRIARKYDVATLLQALQVLFAHWSLEFSLDNPTWGFATSQKVVYSHPGTWLMFGDYMLSVNIELLLHISNFFKYHLTSQQEGTLYYLFQELSDDQKPRTWEGPLRNGVRQIGASWKGSYAYLHDTSLVEEIRSEQPGSNIFIDTIDYEDGFQTLKLNFNQAGCRPWPQEYEHHLRALPPQFLASVVQNHVERAPLRGVDYLVFTGTGVDASPFNCFGVLHGLTEQQGIPGWQRISMMKCFDTAATTTSSSPTSSGTARPATAYNPYSPAMRALAALDGKVNGGTSIALDDNNYWAYEGVVLPGGMMILGRWWSPMDDRTERLSIGPFIFWNVPNQRLLTA